PSPSGLITTLTCLAPVPLGAHWLITPVMPRWMISSSPAERGSTRNLPRRPTRSIRWPTARSRSAYLRPAGARRSTAAMRLPVSHGASSRLTVSTSGSSGIGDLPFVQRPADDRPLQPESLVEVEVGVAADAAAGQQVAGEGGAHLRDGGLVDALHGAVTQDVGVDEVGDPPTMHLGGQVGRLQLGGLDPASHRDLAGARVDRHADPLRPVTFDELADELRLGHRDGAEHHAVDDLQPALGVGGAADAAAELEA